MPYIFAEPRAVPLSTAVTAVPGAMAYFFYAGTTDPRATYPTAVDADARTNPQTVPVLGNSVGTLPPIWLNASDGPFKVDIKTAAGISLPRYPIDNVQVIPLSQNDLTGILNPATEGEITAGVVPSNYYYEVGDLRRYGGIGNGGADDSIAWQRAVKVGNVIIPDGYSFKIVTPATKTGRICIRGFGTGSRLLSDSTVLTVTQGTDSELSNFWMQNLTAPWIITRAPGVLYGDSSAISTLRQSNEDGYQPTINDVVIWDALTAPQQNQQVGPTITFTGDSENILIDRIYGRFVRIDILDSSYSTVRHCKFRGGKGMWGSIVFDNATNGIKDGIGNKALFNYVEYASFCGVVAMKCDRFIDIGNMTEFCGESGNKPAGGGDRKCIRAIVIGNVSNDNYADGLDCITSFPTNTTIDAFHILVGNLGYNNGGDGANVDGRYTLTVGNVFSNNGQYGLWATGAYSKMSCNLFYNNNRKIDPSFADLIGGGAGGNHLTDNMIIQGGSSNASPIYSDNANFIAGNYVPVGGPIFYGAVPNSFSEANVDTNTKLQTTQNFVLSITNDLGVIKHAFYNQSGANTLNTYAASRVNAASATSVATPTGTDASTAFASGAKIGSASTNVIWLDTADQTAYLSQVFAVVSSNDAGTAVHVAPILLSININGVTRTRLGFRFTNATTGAAFALTTGNIASTKTIQIQFYGKLA